MASTAESQGNEMTGFQDFCAPGVNASSRMLPVSDHVHLRLIRFSPESPCGNPPVLFVPGWISLITGWRDTLRELTKDHEVLYLETREKNSSVVTGPASYRVEDLSGDLAAAAELLNLKDKEYILFGSSLGATVILDAVHKLTRMPLALALVGPNAVFRVPGWGIILVKLFYPGWYQILKPFVKWYLKHFRLNTKSDLPQYQKYCRALDAADPWKQKAAVLAFADYQVWHRLKDIEIPALIFNASKDVMHEPANLMRMSQMMTQVKIVDMNTNSKTHSREMVRILRSYLKTLHR